MTNVILAMEYAAKIDREALKNGTSELGPPFDKIYDKQEWTEIFEKKEWVGLTDAEIKDIVGRGGHGGIGLYTREMFKKIEDKLREKNT